MAKAIWNGEVLAESDRGILVEGNIYFPPDSVKKEFLKRSQTEYTCPWKGQAGYYDVVVKGKGNRDAAWFIISRVRWLWLSRTMSPLIPAWVLKWKGPPPAGLTGLLATSSPGFR